MLVTMRRIRVVGPRRELEGALEELHRLGVVHLDRATPPDAPTLAPSTEHRREELRGLVLDLDALLALAPPSTAALPVGDAVPGSIDIGAARIELDAVAGETEAAVHRLDELEAETVVLPRYVEPLRRLLPLIPELANLTDADLRALRLDTAALVLDVEDDLVVDLLRAELEHELGRRFELVSARVDPESVGCVLVFPHEAGETVHRLLSKEHVRHVALPERFADLSLRSAVEGMERRLEELPALLDAARAEVRSLVEPHADGWRALRAGAVGELEQLDAQRLAGSTGRAYVIEGWVPKREVPALRAELERRLDGRVVVEELQTARRDVRAPVLQHNPVPARPFESLVRFLDVPRAGSIDPTLVMALFLPFMFGVMVGDVGYGAILLVLALVARRTIASRPGVLRDIGWVLALGSAWAIVFGVLFGELFGDLGKRLFGGDWALWMYRPGADALEPLLLFAIAIGVVHVGLGLVLGMWQSARFREGRQLLDRLGTLLVIAGLLAIAGIAADQLPAGAITPAVAAAIVGLVLVLSLHGAMGLALGPLELIGALGNILSYLRLAAVGLASAYLAIVANELAAASPIWIGIVVALFFHALNLALAAFSPMVQSLRLHYVESFSKFFVGGGTPYRPFGARDDAGAALPDTT